MSTGRDLDQAVWEQATHRGTVFGKQGQTIRYWQYGTTGDPIILCNSLFGGPGLWKHFLERFSVTHRVLLWEYPGHGVSIGVDPINGISVGSFAEDCLMLLEGVGIDKAVFVGHGVGVQVILEVYGQNPERVRALVGLCGAEKGRLSRLAPFRKGQVAARFVERLFVPLGTPFLKALERLWIVSLPFRRGVRGGVPSNPESATNKGNAWLKQISRTDPQVGLQLLASALFYHPGPLLPQIRVPVLIVGGTKDRLVPPERYLRMVKRIPGSRLVLLDGCSHQAMVQAPEKVHALVEEFLSDQGLAEASP